MSWRACQIAKPSTLGGRVLTPPCGRIRMVHRIQCSTNIEYPKITRIIFLIHEKTATYLLFLFLWDSPTRGLSKLAKIFPMLMAWFPWFYVRSFRKKEDVHW